MPCEADADCEGAHIELVCGVDANGANTCVYDCNEDASCTSETCTRACVDGVSTSCALVDRDEYCEACGCNDPLLRCEPGVGCMPLSEVGGPCRYDAECKTDNCNWNTERCMVPLGAECTADNCDMCVTDGAGFSYCSRACSSSDSCNGLGCVQITDDFARCVTLCASDGSSSCPVQCEPVIGLSKRACICDECSVSASKLPLGESCDDSSECQSGTCLGYGNCLPGGSCFLDGYCSTECTSDSDCGDDGACAAVECYPTEPITCSYMCLPRCSAGCGGAGQCIGVPTIADETVMACDPHRENGAACSEHAQCLSARCTDGSCVAAPGSVTNGEACSSDDECASADCRDGRCLGTSLIGDPCELDADCAVGRCTDGLCR